ncbi:diguanylate cyclase [Qipengyuania nanhaisediminis]|uniref:GGDEF domain-containing protein n=1 Tax=Qipengyuania nanhaisediminis TaxID=604088 RepID=UPI0038B3B580
MPLAPALPPFTATATGLSGDAAVANAAIGSDALFVTSLAFGLIALAALTGVIRARREARATARVARARSRSISDLLRTMRMAESIAGIGVWQYDPETGVQNWSDGLRKLFGIEHDDAFVEGDAETMLYAHEMDLVARVNEHSEEDEPYTMQFEVDAFHGETRWMSVQACNLRAADGSVSRVVAVVRDNTAQMERVRELESARREAISVAQTAREQAETDALTGLANRRQVMRKLDRLVLDARVTQMPLVLVVFDIDRFKQVNDTYGHPAGDAVLRTIARIARAHARDGDLIGRVGGEEFVWVIPGAVDTMAGAMSERLREAIARKSATGQVPPVTISIGYAAIQAGDTALSLFARADGALYEAKHGGRNQVCMAA